MGKTKRLAAPPGLMTSILTVPLWGAVSRSAIAEGRLTRREVSACVAVAGLVHGAVVARQLLFIGVPASR